MHLKFKNLCKEFSGEGALDDISLEIKPGQIVAVVGANGAGKSTLLGCISTMIEATSGQILFDDVILDRNQIEQRKKFFLLPDGPVVFDEWTPIQHAAMVFDLYGRDIHSMKEPLADLWESLDVLALCHAPLGFLSRGQRYKAVMAILIILNPSLWLFDEPFASGMDPHGIHVFREQVRVALDHKRTIIYTTQMLDLAEKFSDKICILHQGKVRAWGSMEEIRDKAGGSEHGLDSILESLRESSL